jgi:hypothetical protein
MNTVSCAPLPIPLTPLLIPQYSNPMPSPQCTMTPLLLPQPVISFTPSPRTSPSPPRMNMIPSLSNSLSQFLGSYHTVSDSRTPGKYHNADSSTSPLRSIVSENNTFRVIFSELNGENQFAQIRIAADGRIQLFSTIYKEYSYFLVNTPEPVPELLRWQNEYDHEHFVDWRRINNRLKMSEMAERSSISSISVSPARSASSNGSAFHFPAVDELNLSEVKSRSRRQSISRPKHPVSRPKRDSMVLPMVPDSLRSQSRESSPAPSCASMPTPRSKAHLYDRDSKQNLVTKVEPEVTALIGEYYAEEKDYRPNQKGRWGPPVLRGDDVLFIPAKKQAALENVVELIKVIKATSTILSASMVCQKKKKRQKKGFLVYLQLSSAEEVQTFLKGPYRHFDSTVQGVKTAVFTTDTK